jgi:competence protein ComEA
MKIILSLLALGSLFSSLVFASVDINKASIKELSSLKGVGNFKAKMIVEYRKGHCFKSIDELSKVKGIGKKILKKNAKDLIVGKCKK